MAFQAIVRLACWQMAVLVAEGNTPPLLNITAATLYDAGLQHGQLASVRIKAWLASEEIRNLTKFAMGEGRAAYEHLRRDSSAASPQYADELRGIAQGAGVSLDQLWVGMLMIELDNLMGSTRGNDHCSDIFAVAPGGYAEGFAHGHNEDWSQEVGELYYYVKYTALPGSGFASCAGFAYPGALIGWAGTWNAHGMFMTVNTLTPRRIRPYGVSTAFIQREAICGLGKGRDLDDVIAGLSVPSWSDGASINLVDVHAHRMANVETYENAHSVLEITGHTGNYSHFNNYKRLGPGVTDRPQASTTFRQARVDEMAPPHSLEDIATMLSDSANSNYPIFRNTTIATLLLDGASGRLRVWCCGSAAASGAPPTYSWSLLNFFTDGTEDTGSSSDVRHGGMTSNHRIILA
eukprot:TRINITY_DN96416_c0_g1_i1.p1 TRINITY_DN96416_c0_g1~~TRINITY_DN96416_c0_g1_i1.p1  ORF type:complete len:406 (+),score=63.90 TRINITY_DN96416_c0_g1_i1:196-1413(+)